MYTLKFINPVGLKSENFSTVRLGEQWAERTKPESISDPVNVYLNDDDGNSKGTANVVSCWTGPLAELPAMLLEISHDPVLRTWSGAAQVLASLYPETEIEYGTIVTVLQLQYTGSIIQLS